MELLKAISKLNNLEKEARDIENWLSDVKSNSNNEKPVYGQNWFKLEKAINNVIGEIYEEIQVLEVRIKDVAEGLEVDTDY